MAPRRPPNFGGGNPFAPVNFNDLEKEFAQAETQQAQQGVKKYSKTDLDAFAAELKAMEEEELKDVDFDGALSIDMQKVDTGERSFRMDIKTLTDEEILQRELTKQVQSLGPATEEIPLTSVDLAIINHAITTDVKKEAAVAKAIKPKKINKENVDSLFTGLKEIED